MGKLARRDALRGLAATILGGSATAGCGPFDTSIGLGNLPPIDPAAPLTVDVHSHVFNGNDLQIEKFIETTQGDSPVIGQILQNLGTDFAPSGQAELAELPIAGVASGGLAQRQYGKARQQIKKAHDRARENNPSLRLHSTSDRVAQNIDALPEKYEEYKAFRRKGFLAAPGRSSAVVEMVMPPGAAPPAETKPDISVDGALAFLIRNFQYRHVNVYDYMEEYSTSPQRQIDLMVTHLVDYDWPLGAAKTSTPLVEQVAVMERIARLTKGRVHAFVPFCPFKQVAHWRGMTSDDPMQLVQNAVTKQGHIGVKMYPPMGFRPFGNAALDPGYWNDTPVDTLQHQALLSPTLGAELDDALRVLYTWCLANDVPIMAHTAPSNTPISKYVDGVLAPQHWGTALNAFPGLRVNFGHFGHTDIVADTGTRARAMMAFMTPETSSVGGKVFADSAYFSEILNKKQAMEDQLKSLFAASAKKGDAALANRLMYGTDWEMVIIEGQATTQYLKLFEDVFADFERDTTLGATGDIANRFFGVNSALYLGLEKGRATRARLDAFHGGAPPNWVAKVDRAFD